MTRKAAVPSVALGHFGGSPPFRVPFSFEATMPSPQKGKGLSPSASFPAPLFGTAPFYTAFGVRMRAISSSMRFTLR